MVLDREEKKVEVLEFLTNMFNKTNSSIGKEKLVEEVLINEVPVKINLKKNSE